MKHRQSPKVEVDPYELERLVHHMPAVISAAPDDWTKGFGKSIIRQARRTGWRPSIRQLKVMRRLVHQLFNEEDIQLIES